MPGEREIRAAYDDRGLTVYQAYRPQIGIYAAEHGRFGAGFKMGRMTWIKPSFGWMLYRCGYGFKSGQEVVLRITISHEGWIEMLSGAVLNHFDSRTHSDRTAFENALKRSECRVQWDPDRTLALERMDRRAIQVGLRGSLVEKYASDWILDIEDVTALAHAVKESLANRAPLPDVPEERVYEVSAEIRARLGM